MTRRTTHAREDAAEPAWPCVIAVDTYLAASGDQELFEVLPPFLTFRALVIAPPRWYPDLAEPTRAVLLRFAERMASATRFILDDATAFGT